MLTASPPIPNTIRQPRKTKKKHGIFGVKFIQPVATSIIVNKEDDGYEAESILSKNGEQRESRTRADLETWSDWEKTGSGAEGGKGEKDPTTPPRQPPGWGPERWLLPPRCARVDIHKGGLSLLITGCGGKDHQEGKEQRTASTLLAHSDFQPEHLQMRGGAGTNTS